MILFFHLKTGYVKAIKIKFYHVQTSRPEVQAQNKGSEVFINSHGLDRSKLTKTFREENFGWSFVKTNVIIFPYANFTVTQQITVL